ncbi:MAG: metal-dependent hydrolase, partial [Nannocystaceae bacterium]
MSHSITVRRMGFEVPETLDPLIIRGEPEESFLLLGMSFLFPYLEPYLIRSMKVARERIEDPELLADLRRFCAQEGQHFREHTRFNRAMQGQDYPGLGELEAALARDYESFTAHKSLRWNLAYAEGFEAMTAATALFLFETRDEREMHPLVEQLMFWHALEELEHRTVAFDVYQQVYGGYLYRLAVGMYAQAHLLLFAVRV